MADDQAAGTIRYWFSIAEAAGLVLPDGWFGRPYDNQLNLTCVEERPSRLLLELDDDLLLVFERPLAVAIDDSVLELSHFTQFIFAWQEFGTATPHYRVFHSGRVRLVPPLAIVIAEYRGAE